MQFYSVEYDSTWEHVGFVLGYSIEYEKQWLCQK
jgi:hypothetical protein